MNVKDCVACGACMGACPQKCIDLRMGSSGFYEAHIDYEACVSCNQCKMVCPNINGYKPDKDMISYHLFVKKNEYHRALSSSGGFFSAAAEYILQKEGVVFGAYIDDSLKIKHGCTEELDDIYRFLTSKYVQSYIGDSFKRVKEYLDNGRYVLFSGTPCQIAGLNSYLNKPYDNLYTVELFCGGIPSPYSWESYIDDYFKRDEIRYVQFRYKYEGWWKFGLRIQLLHDDYYYSMREMKDPFTTSYLKNYNVNNMCFDCKYKANKKNADFTIGDAWNINRIRKNMDDNRGITSVIINSHKGKELFDVLRVDNYVFDQSKEEALFARGELESVKVEPDGRKKFFDDLMEHGFRYAYENNILCDQLKTR